MKNVRNVGAFILHLYIHRLFDVNSSVFCLFLNESSGLIPVYLFAFVLFMITQSSIFVATVKVT